MYSLHIGRVVFDMYSSYFNSTWHYVMGIKHFFFSGSYYGADIHIKACFLNFLFLIQLRLVFDKKVMIKCWGYNSAILSQSSGRKKNPFKNIMRLNLTSCLDPFLEKIVPLCFYSVKPCDVKCLTKFHRSV